LRERALFEKIYSSFLISTPLWKSKIMAYQIKINKAVDSNSVELLRNITDSSMKNSVVGRNSE